MSGLFESLVQGAVQESLHFDRLLNKQQRDNDFAELRKYYRGGSELVSELIQHEAEHDDDFQLRKDKFASINFVRRIVDEIANGIYGGEVKRTIVAEEGDSSAEKQQQALDAVWEYSGGREFGLEMGTAIASEGGEWIHGSFVDHDKQVCLHSVMPENMDFEVNPDNPRQLRAVVETRTLDFVDQKAVNEYWAWVSPGFDETTAETFRLGWGLKFDDHGNILNNEFYPNKYGRIPYVYSRGLPDRGLYEGKPYTKDAITIQRLILNAVSDLWRTIKYQSFGVPVFEGDVDDEQTISEYGYIKVQIGGKFYFAAPNAPIGDVINSIEKLIDWMAQTGNIPVQIIKSDSIPESGIALTIKFQPFTKMVEAARMRAKQAEMGIYGMICAIGSAHGLALPEPGKAELQVEFTEPITPTDKPKEREQDQLDLESGNLTQADYLMRWHKGIDTEDQAEKYIETLAKEREAREATTPEPSSEKRQSELEGNLL